MGEGTAAVRRTVGQWVCDYHDDVEALQGFGAGNAETLGELVWAFFEYWAWKHDYNNAVISVRTGGFLTKSQKEWTRRVGNERHLVCIEVRCGRLFWLSPHPRFCAECTPHVEPVCCQGSACHGSRSAIGIELQSAFCKSVGKIWEAGACRDRCARCGGVCIKVQGTSSLRFGRGAGCLPI